MCPVTNSLKEKRKFPHRKLDMKRFLSHSDAGNLEQNSTKVKFKIWPFLLCYCECVRRRSPRCSAVRGLCATNTTCLLNSIYSVIYKILGWTCLYFVALCIDVHVNTGASRLHTLVLINARTHTHSTQSQWLAIRWSADNRFRQL